MTRFKQDCPMCGTQVATRHLTHAHDKECWLRNPCPDCHRRVGQWCQGPAGHKAMRIHKSRRELAESPPTPEPDPSFPDPYPPPDQLWHS